MALLSFSFWQVASGTRDSSLKSPWMHDGIQGLACPNSVAGERHADVLPIPPLFAFGYYFFQYTHNG